MHSRFDGWPETNDSKWFGIRKGGDLPRYTGRSLWGSTDPCGTSGRRSSSPSTPGGAVLGRRARRTTTRISTSRSLRWAYAFTRVHRGRWYSSAPAAASCGRRATRARSWPSGCLRRGLQCRGVRLSGLPVRPRGPTADAIRAVRYLRDHATGLNTPADKIGMMGFSAGAMLTGWCATMFDAGDPDAADPVERCSSRPDAAVLCYGAGSGATASQGLLRYDRARHAEAAEDAIERRVPLACPPFFIWQCAGQDDPRNATQFADVLGTAACRLSCTSSPMARTVLRSPTKCIPTKAPMIRTPRTGWRCAASG